MRSFGISLFFDKPQMLAAHPVLFAAWWLALQSGSGQRRRRVSPKAHGCVWGEVSCRLCSSVMRVRGLEAVSAGEESVSLNPHAHFMEGCGDAYAE